MYEKMEVNDVRCCDTAALVALINMLKVNLGSTPEIYNTLLAVLCDYDPSKLGNRERTVRYIRLLVSDKVLANCLLMSLPHGSTGWQTQNVHVNTGSMPDMKKAIKQKFLGMKLSLQSSPLQSREQNDKPVNITNQNLTILVTDQEISGNDSAQLTGLEGKPHSPSQTSPDHQRPETTENCGVRTSSQAKCVITFTKSSTSSSGSTVPSSLTQQYAKVPNSKAVSSEFQSKQNVALVKTTSSQSNHSNMTIYLKNKSEISVDKNSSSVTLQGHTPKGTLNQCKRQARTTSASSGPVNMQAVSLVENTTSNVIPQARLPGANMPLSYQQFANPLHGQSCYRPSLTGPTIQPLFPWTPVHYLPGFLPSYNLGFVGHQTRSASVSGIDNISLDLSLPRSSTALTSACQVEAKGNDKAFPGTKTGTKRCASTTCIPSQIEETRQKVRKLSAEVPLAISRKNNQPVTPSCQSFLPSTTDYSLHESLNKDRFGGQLNSLQALQELTSRICPKPEALTIRKSLSTSSLPQAPKGQRFKEMNNYHTGGTLTVSSSQKSLENHNYLSTTQSAAQNIFLAYKVPAVSVNSKTNVPQSTAGLQKYIASPVERTDGYMPFNVQEKSGSLHIGQTVTSCQPSGMAESVLGVSSSLNPLNTCVSYSEKFDISIPSGTHCISPVCQKNFPYSQQIQLPDGKCSVINFPAHLPKTITKSKSFENFLSTEKENTDVRKFGCQSEGITEGTKTPEDQVVNIDCSKSNKPENFSLYLKRDDIIGTKKIVENQDPSLAVQPEVSSTEGETDPETTNTGKTCLIIETTSENGTEQVQFKLDKQRGASLLGELLKLKPVQNNLSCVHAQRSSTGESMHQRKVIAENGCNSTKNDPISRPEVTIDSFNVSPYLLGMLPDTTSFSDTFDDNDDDDDDYYHDDCDDNEKGESYSDEDDDVFLHPIY